MTNKKETIKWIALFVAIVLLFAGVGTSLYMIFGHKTAESVQQGQEQNADELPVENENVETAAIMLSNFQESGIRLMAAPVLLAANNVEGTRSVSSAFEKTLTATVLPVDAPDKSVDWSVAWGENASHGSQDVNTYIIVTPSANGSNVATVRCLKAFEGDIVIITVTTRVGGFKATCQVEYKGIPQTMEIDLTGKTVNNDSAWNKSMVELSCGQTHTFNLNLDNDLHAVGSTFGNYTFSMEAFGSITTNDRNHSNTTGEDTYTTSTEVYRVADCLEDYGYMYAFFQKGGGMLVAVHVEIQNGQLVVQAQDAISSYYSMSGGRPGYSERTFKNYTDGKVPYVTITVTETTTGLSQSINVKTIASVSKVEMSDSTLTF